MSSSPITDLVVHEPPVLHIDDTVIDAVSRLLEAKLPALPVVDENESYVGIFGEREFMAALMPGYFGELKYAAFVSRSVDEALERRKESRDEPIRRYVNTEHVDVAPDFSDAEVTEIFLHHRVLVIPVVDRHRVAGLVLRRDFFGAIARRFVEGD